MLKNKEEIRIDLIVKAREILKDKGLEFLTARKLADYSGYSVGTIYNQFKSMDTLVLWENCQTLDELNMALSTVEIGSDAYKNINRLIDRFVEFVFQNKNLWFTLYNFHFRGMIQSYDFFYLKRILMILMPFDNHIHKLFPKVSHNERKLSTEVLFVSLFALSSLLTTEKEFSRLEKRYVVKILLNTYLAGVKQLENK